MRKFQYFCAAFLCGAAGIVRTLESSAAYIEEWSNALSKDPKMIVQAAAEAQRAADFILGRVSTKGDEVA